MDLNLGDEARVIPIEFGHQLKTRRQEGRETFEVKNDAALRRLMQCVEMMREIAIDIARTR